MHRRNLGKHFSEGARLAWLELRARAWTLADLTKNSGQDGSAIHRVMYGDRKPPLAVVLPLQQLFGVPVAMWALPPAEPFTLPGAEDQEQHRATGTEGG
ncbi:MAG TPA: hypothetical protein VH062_01885 [Polyangiaceae bacterium]|jgi:hypothetical protein|nr:hypothetical protein [Polyangiaceae bacterium]